MEGEKGGYDVTLKLKHFHQRMNIEIKLPKEVKMIDRGIYCRAIWGVDETIKCTYDRVKKSIKITEAFDTLEKMPSKIKFTIFDLKNPLVKLKTASFEV